MGTVIEVLSGDTLVILPNGEAYDDESKLKKISLASIRAPRAGNERKAMADEPYAAECKDRLRALTIGKAVKVNIHYEKEIPMGANTEKRQFGTVSVGKRVDVGETLVSEGLAKTQRHRDDDEKSIRYDELVAAEVSNACVNTVDNVFSPFFGGYSSRFTPESPPLEEHCNIIQERSSFRKGIQSKGHKRSYRSQEGQNLLWIIATFRADEGHRRLRFQRIKIQAFRPI